MTVVGATPMLQIGKGVLASQPNPAAAGRSARPGVAPALYHYTCWHMASRIVAVGALLPNAHPFLPRLRAVVWLTSEPEPDAVALGLTAEHLRCDRTKVRFLVTEYEGVVPWLAVVDSQPPAVLDPRIVKRLHAGRRPETWWVSPFPTPVVLA